MRAVRDYALLVGLGALFLVCLALHLRTMLRYGHGLPPVWVASALDDQHYPTVVQRVSVAPNAPELARPQPGDELLTVGGVDARGLSEPAVAALFYGQVKTPDDRVALRYRSTGGT